MSIFNKKALIIVAAVAGISVSQSSLAALNYSEDFEGLDTADGNALHPDESGWHIGNCNVVTEGCWFGDAQNHNPAPNTTGNSALNGYSALVGDQGGVDQGDVQLSTYSDYNGWSPFTAGATELQVFIFKDLGTITADMVGNTYQFSFNAKEGNIGEGNATANAYISVVKQSDASFDSLSNTTTDTHNVGTDWAGGSVSVTIDAAWVGELLQIGFSNTTTVAWEATGVFYDNLNFDAAPVSAGPASNDFNNDGNADILFRKDTGAQVVWTMDGATRTSSAVVGGLSTAWTVVAVDDFDADGDADILYRNMTVGSNQIWTMNGITRLSANLIGSATTNFAVTGTGDFNNDGNADILFRSSAGSQLVWTMDGSTRTSTVIIGGLSTAWTTVAVDDFDGDGDADILYRDLSTGRNMIWTMNGTTRQSANLIGSATTNFAVSGTGDFNNDGKADILFRSTTGSQLVWNMNGSTRTSTVLIGGLNAAWTIEAVADFDGDGDADILYRDLLTGSNQIWTMNGVTRQSADLIGSAATSFSVQPE